jgi:hypothetical protein
MARQVRRKSHFLPSSNNQTTFRAIDQIARMFPTRFFKYDLALSEATSHRISSEPAEETPLLFLRQIAPPGFLTQAFAVDSAGCTS